MQKVKVFLNNKNTFIKNINSQLVNVSEVLEVLKQPTETCEILGREQFRRVNLIDQNSPSKGIIVTYGGGDKCTSGDNAIQLGKPRESNFKLNCAASHGEVNKIFKNIFL